MNQRAWPQRALVRGPSPAYAPTYANRRVAIDQALAERQHKAYVAALRGCGLEVEALAPDAARFDSVFIEDTAVVWGDRALLTRMTPAREGEQGAVADALRDTHEIVRLPEGALLEGGDVLHAEGVTFVGLSSRTNEAGADAVAALVGGDGRQVVRVPVERCLHLKTGATWLGDGTILAAPSLIDMDAFREFEIIEVEKRERGAANAIRLEGAVLMAAGRPRAQARVKAFCSRGGLELRALEISEFEKGDGSLTCMSILW